ncbi:uncharacterized protein NEMAJ01_1755 [Nematocida major]|uniref:uncharacterized protein n=1 Tax=Nematocida major TaxID=1912982 RepID=UPI002007454B|nr:uncharacterized protein NEMAJ01_1755 [Nematocida major]KAH9386859.1 hypothetical protein NEMAJ01_1755 [Nematocida major]
MHAMNGDGCAWAELPSQNTGEQGKSPQGRAIREKYVFSLISAGVEGHAVFGDVFQVYAEIVEPCTRISRQLWGSPGEQGKKSTIKQLDQAMRECMDKGVPLEEAKRRILLQMPKAYQKALKDFSLPQAAAYIITEEVLKSKHDECRAKLSRVKQENFPGIAEYAKRCAELISPLEIASVIYSTPPATLEEVEAFSREFFYNGLLSENKKMLSCMRQQKGPLQEMYSTLKSHEALLREKARNEREAAAKKVYAEIERQTVYLQKAQRGKTCILHPTGTHTESECKLKKMVKKSKKK